jgi:hypothetical protein
MSQQASGTGDRSNEGRRGSAPSADEAVLAYLAAIEAHRVAPDTLPHPDSSGEALAGADMVHGDDGGEELATELATQTPGSEDNIRLLEDAFVADAADYGRRHNVSYRGWIEAGVDARVLERAGVGPDDG